MDRSQRERRQSNNTSLFPTTRYLQRIIIGVSVALALFTVAGILAFGSSLTPSQTQPLMQLTWVQPVAQSFVVLAALSIALLCYGRYRALGGAWVLLTSLTFLANGIIGIFYLLSWPELAGEGGLIARLPNTSSWLFALFLLSIPSLLVAVNLRRPQRFSPMLVRTGYLVAFVTAVLMGLLSVLFEDRLPVFVVDNSFTSWSLYLVWAFIAMGVAGAISAYRRYVNEGDMMLAYMALFFVLMSFEMLYSIVAGRRYDLWWYIGRVNLVAAYLVLLFGLLQEGYRLLQENEQLAAMAQRRASELQTTLESIADAIFVYDRHGRITLINNAGLALLGDKTSERQHTLTDLHESLQVRYPDGRTVPLDDMGVTRALRGEVMVGREKIAVHPQTQRRIHLLISAAPVRDNEGRIIGAVQVTTNITLVKELTELDRLKDEFIASAAHELKTPVAVVKGYAQLLHREAANITPAGRKILEAIDRGSNRIDRLVTDLLDLSRLQTGKLSMQMDGIRLDQLVVDVVNEIRSTFARCPIRVVVSEPVVVRGDRTRLEQVLIHLIENAVKYSPSGEAVEVRLVTKDRQAVLSVVDRGVGIPKDRQARIFERFYRAHAGTAYDYGGMGVGLYVSKEIISLHHGEMCFESEEGRGSVFYFSLPLEEA